MPWMVYRLKCYKTKTKKKKKKKKSKIDITFLYYKKNWNSHYYVYPDKIKIDDSRPTLVALQGNNGRIDKTCPNQGVLNYKKLDRKLTDLLPSPRNFLLPKPK